MGKSGNLEKSGNKKNDQGKVGINKKNQEKVRENFLYDMELDIHNHDLFNVL
jgi:hypothetical protein